MSAEAGSLKNPKSSPLQPTLGARDHRHCNLSKEVAVLGTSDGDRKTCLLHRV